MITNVLPRFFMNHSVYINSDKNSANTWSIILFLVSQEVDKFQP